MQTQEFDKLIDGDQSAKIAQGLEEQLFGEKKPIKWADMTNEQQLNILASGELKERVAEMEEPIPDEIFDEIQEFIMKLRKKKKPARYIKRAVIKKFNIQIV